MALQALPPAGGSLPHNNMQPFLTVHVHHRDAGRVPAARLAMIVGSAVPEASRPPHRVRS